MFIEIKMKTSVRYIVSLKLKTTDISQVHRNSKYSHNRTNSTHHALRGNIVKAKKKTPQSRVRGMVSNFAFSFKSCRLQLKQHEIK